MTFQGGYAVDDHSTKRCTKCNNEYPATHEYFNFSKFGKAGLEAQCKKCRHEYYENHKEIILRRTREYAIAHKEEISAKRKAVYVRKPRKTTPERVKAQKKRYYDANREKIRARQRAKTKNRQAQAVQKQRRRAAEKQLPNAFTQADWKHALAYFNGCCAICGRPPGLWHTIAADHWIPLKSPSCPGTIPQNIVPLCHGIEGCNNTKASRDPDKWLIEKFGKRKAAKILKRIAAYFESIGEPTT
jgi:hypothetical protein